MAERESRGELGRLALPASAVTIVLVSLWPLLSWPLAPLPPVADVRFGTRELFGRELGATWCLAVPRASLCRLVFRARSLSPAPASARAVLRDAEDRVVVSGRIEAPPRPEVVDVPLEAPPFLLAPGRDYRLGVTEADPGFALDALALDTGSAPPVTLEAEEGELTAGTLVGLDASASSGRWIGLLPGPRPGVERVTQTFRAAADGLAEVVLNLYSRPGASGGVRIALADRTDAAAARPIVEESVPSASLAASSLHRLRFPSIPSSRGRTFEIAIEQSASRPVGIPIGPRDAFRDGELRVGIQRLESELMFVPGYASRWNLLAATAIPLIGLLLWIGLRSRGAGRAVVTGIAALLGLLSVAGWQREYQYVSPSERMPDGYGVYAERVREVLTGAAPGGVTALLADLKSYPHAHSPLTPVAVATVSLVVPDVVRAYLLVTFLFSLGTAWCLLFLLEEVPGATWAAVWATWGAGVTHFLFVRAATRASTDPVGLFFVALGVLLAARILRRGTTTASLAALVAALTLGLLARPSVLPLIPVLALVPLAAPPGDRRRVPAALAIALLPPGLFFGSMGLAGLLPTFALAGQKMSRFADARTPARFLVCTALLVGLLAVPALVPVADRRQAPPRRLGIATTAAYLLFLAVAVTFWNRHFLPALPGVLLAALPGADRWQRERPGRVRLFLWACVALGLGWTALTLRRGVGVGPPYLID